MKVITTNRLNRFWKNGVLPIKNTLANKLNTSSVVNNLLTTAAGYALDARQGKALDDKITALNGKLIKVEYKGSVANNPGGKNYIKLHTVTVANSSVVKPTFVVIATNGHQNANDVRIISTDIWKSGSDTYEFYAYFNTTVSNPVQVNFMILRL